MTDVGRRRYRGAAARHPATKASHLGKKDPDSADDEEDDLDDDSDDDDDNEPTAHPSSRFPSRGKHQTVSAATGVDALATSAGGPGLRGIFPAPLSNPFGSLSAPSLTSLGSNGVSGPLGPILHDPSALQGLRALGTLASSAPQMAPFGSPSLFPSPDAPYNFYSIPGAPSSAPHAQLDPSQYGMNHLQIQHFQKLQQQQLLQLQHQYQQQQQQHQLQHMLQSGLSLHDIQQFQLRQLLQQQQQQQAHLYNSLLGPLNPGAFSDPSQPAINPPTNSNPKLQTASPLSTNGNGPHPLLQVQTDAINALPSSTAMDVSKPDGQDPGLSGDQKSTHSSPTTLELPPISTSTIETNHAAPKTSTAPPHTSTAMPNSEMTVTPPRHSKSDESDANTLESLAIESERLHEIPKESNGTVEGFVPKAQALVN